MNIPLPGFPGLPVGASLLANLSSAKAFASKLAPTKGGTHEA
ncbi:hypothetical protein J2T46_002691 [Pseudomonas citronellolis]|nr:hypothetical protein [Pseudomonas citronellolis]MCP1654917.1 hypothetical protein [Pseudomonas citronellolis]MCP1722470.1 hypothetical protein [Pseudomonas citronellolis]